MTSFNTTLIFPVLGPIYQALSPVMELLLRVAVGAALVPYALRSSFGFFPNTGLPIQTVRGTADYLERFGWKPAYALAWLSTVNNVVGGSMLALGLLTRPAAFLSFLLLIMSACHHLRKDGYFANQNGFEHYALWALGALYFVIHGGGPYSLDHLLGWQV
jgi:putative oxidoreductase